MSGRRFLVDSGAEVSVTPFSSDRPASSTLRTADGKPVPCWGRELFPVNIAGVDYGRHPFVKADVQQPILGADFFSRTGLCIDVKRRVLSQPAVSAAAVANLSVRAVDVVEQCSALSSVVLDHTPPVSCRSGRARRHRFWWQGRGQARRQRRLQRRQNESGASLPPASTSQLGVTLRPPRPSEPPAVRRRAQTLASKRCGSSTSQLGAPCRVAQALSHATCGQQGTSTCVCFQQSSERPAVCSLHAADFVALLDDFPTVTNKDGLKFASPDPAHGVFHHIVTEGPPVSAHPRRLDAAKLAAAKAEFESMEAAGIIRRSDSPWSSPLHLVRKPDGSWRPTGDYRRMNRVTVPDSYPLPNILDFSANLAGKKFFSKIDLVKGYYQVPMAAEDMKKTAVVTPFGMFEFRVMPFGVRNAAQSFQRLMDRVLNGLPFVFVYLDDILIASATREEHLEDCRVVLQRLHEHGLVINPAKSSFCLPAVDYLGHHVTAAGIAPLGKNTEALESFPVPSSKQDLQRFIGMINFYRRFLPAAAATLRPLTEALKGGKQAKLQWSEECSAAFVDAKKMLSEAVVLHHPVHDAPVGLSVDASSSHVGGVLHQVVRDVRQPLAFFSAKLSSAEEKYSAFDRELLAVFSAVRHFRFSLEGRPFVVYTDHRPLVHALDRKSPPWSARQQRQLSYLSEFDVSLIHVPGRENVVADCLSRPPAVSSVQLPPPPSPMLDYAVMAADQLTCPSVAKLMAGGKLKVETFSVSDGQLLCDVSAATPRPLVPLSWQSKVFSAVHELAHPGTKASSRLISAKFVWHGLARDVARWCKQCVACQRSKIVRHASRPLVTIPVPELPFSSINVDLVGPLPVSEGFRYLFTVVDRATRWPEAFPVKDMSASSCAAAFVQGWVARFGVPAVVTSDRGAQFCSAFWSKFCNILGIEHSRTTAYHPQSNGMVERFHRRLKDALRTRGVGSAWVPHLPWTMLGIRTSPRERSAVSPAEYVFGTPLTLPAQFVTDNGFGVAIHRRLAGHSAEQPVHNRRSVRRLEKELLAADAVFVRDDVAAVPPLEPRYKGPFRVLSRGDGFFTLQLGDRVDSVSQDRLKPAFLPLDAPMADVPRRGRPKKNS